MKKLFTTIILCFGTLAGIAQEQTQVITKQFERTISVKAGDKLEIKGEKAKITIEEHNRSEIELHVIFVARHPNKETAESEMDYMRYTLQQSKEIVYIENYFLIPKKVQKVNSNLQAELVIKIPPNMPVKLSNYFGNTALSNLSGQLDISSEYGLLDLNNCKGHISADITFTDLKLQKCNNVSIRGNNSDIHASIFNGRLEFTGENTDITIQSSGTITGSIKVQNGDVIISGLAINRQSLELISVHGQIEVPAPLEVITGHDNAKVIFKENQSFPLFKVSSTFGKIKINKT